MKIITLVAAAAAAILAIPAASAAPVSSAAPAAISAAAIAASSPANLVQDGRRYGRDDRRRSYDRRHRRAFYRTVCTRKWRNGHRVRTCRKVRYYR